MKKPPPRLRSMERIPCTLRDGRTAVLEVTLESGSGAAMRIRVELPDEPPPSEDPPTGKPPNDR